MQSELGSLRSTSFYKASSPVLSSAHDLQQQGSLIARDESFLKTHTGGKASGMSGLLPGPALGKLQPLGPIKPSRSRRILTAVDKLLGRASSSNSLDSTPQSRQDVTAEIRCAAVAHASSDSEPQDSISVVKPLLQTLKEPSQALENVKMVVDLETTKERSLFLEGEKLGQDKGGRRVEGRPPVDLSPGEGAARTVCPVPDPQLQASSGLGEVAGTSGDPANPVLDEEEQGARPEGGGGGGSSLADHLASQISGMPVAASPRQDAVGFKTGRLQSPGEGQGGSLEKGQAEGEPVQSRTQAQNASRPELSPAGDGGKEVSSFLY